MSARPRPFAQRVGGLLLTLLLASVQLVAIGALWLGDDARCGCTSGLCCRSARPDTMPPPLTSKACHDAAGSKDDAVFKCAPPASDLVLPLLTRGMLPNVVTLQPPAGWGAATLPASRTLRAGSFRIDLPPPRYRLLAA